VVAAQLIIDAVGRMVYTRSPSTNTLVSASLSPIVSESTDVHYLNSSVPRDEPSPSTSSLQAALEPSDPSKRVVDDPLASRDDESAPLPSVRPPPDTSYSVFAASDSDVQVHLRVPFFNTVEETHISPTMASDFKELLIRHQDAFAKSGTDIGFCNILEHDIDTGDAASIRQPPRRPTLASGTAEDDLIKEMPFADDIEPSDSPWASPVCLAKKPDGTYRFCVDYRRVNAVSRKDAYLIPNIQDAFDSLRVKYFATIDLLSEYWQRGMTPMAQEHSAFCTCRGLSQFKRMPFGLSNAPATFCRVMNQVLRDHL